jgi:hypothetical protein
MINVLCTGSPSSFTNIIDSPTTCGMLAIIVLGIDIQDGLTMVGPSLDSYILHVEGLDIPKKGVFRHWESGKEVVHNLKARIKQRLTCLLRTCSEVLTPFGIRKHFELDTSTYNTAACQCGLLKIMSKAQVVFFGDGNRFAKLKVHCLQIWPNPITTLEMSVYRFLGEAVFQNDTLCVWIGKVKKVLSEMPSRPIVMKMAKLLTCYISAYLGSVVLVA